MTFILVRHQHASFQPYNVLADQGRLRPKIKYEVSSCQTVNWTSEVACWFSFSLFWKFRQLRIRQRARAYGFVFERHQRTIFSLRSCTACARVLSLCMLARSRGAARDGSCSRTWRQRRKVDKCRVADKKQTDKHTLLFYRYRLATSVVWKTRLLVSITLRVIFGYKRRLHVLVLHIASEIDNRNSTVNCQTNHSTSCEIPRNIGKRSSESSLSEEQSSHVHLLPAKRATAPGRALLMSGVGLKVRQVSLPRLHWMVIRLLSISVDMLFLPAVFAAPICEKLRSMPAEECGMVSIAAASFTTRE